MNYLTTITKKGQITIPKELREKLGFKEFLRVVLELEEKGKVIKVRPVTDILDLAGDFKSENKESVLEARKSLETSYKRK